MRRVLMSLVLFGLVAVAGTAMAIDPIPEKPGWSGYVIVGASGIDAETNMVKGIGGYGIDIGKETIGSLSESPESKSTGAPQLGLNVNYTFSSRTQLFLGNSLENVVELDRTSVLGVRQQFRDKSILELGLITTPVGAPLAVWEDPYVVGVPRAETDRTSRGVKLEYDRIAGSGFGVMVSTRSVDIDDERSGLTQLGLPPEEARLLEREGTIDRYTLSYRFPSKGRSQFQLTAGLRQDDLDGKAMSGDQNEFRFIHAYVGDRFVTATNVFYITEDFDEVNPVFDRKRDEDTVGIAFFLFDRKLFHSAKWWGSLQAIWVDQDSNIDFYDAGSSILSLGAMYRF